MTLHRSERLENLWRSVVPWLLRHRAVLDDREAEFLEEIISSVTISDQQRGRLTDILTKAIQATGKRPWDH
jgi:hypothetical protein